MNPIRMLSRTMGYSIKSGARNSSAVCLVSPLTHEGLSIRGNVEEQPRSGTASAPLRNGAISAARVVMFIAVHQSTAAEAEPRKAAQVAALLVTEDPFLWETPFPLGGTRTANA